MITLILAGLAVLFTGIAFILQKSVMTALLFFIMIISLMTSLISSPDLKVVFSALEAIISVGLLIWVLRRKRA